MPVMQRNIQGRKRPARAQMVAANRFDPTQSGSSMIDPAARLAQISTEWDTNPGRAPGGSGSTGLLANDAQGWSSMLNQQAEAARLQDYLRGGEGTVGVRLGEEGTPFHGQLGAATGENNADAFGLNAGISGQNLLDARKKAPAAYAGILAASKGRQF